MTQRKRFLEACHNNVIEEMRKLHDDEEFFDQETYDSAIRIAAAAGFTEIVKCLVSWGAKYYETNFPLYYAICAGHGDVVELLVESGADVKECDDGYMLGFAAHAGSIKTVEILLKNGIDVKARDNYAICRATSFGETILEDLFPNQYPVVHPYNSVLDMIRGRNIRISYYHEYCKRLIKEEEHVKIVELLLENGADASANSNTPMLNALEHEDHDVVKLLQKYGAKLPVT